MTIENRGNIKNIFILSYIVFAVLAQAEEKEIYTLLPVMVTGTRTGYSLRVPVTVYPENNIAVTEALKELPGLDLQTRGLLGSQADISIRGSTYQQILILIDGMRVNDPQTAHHNMDLPVPLSVIEKIEVLKGQASSVYGADAFGGVVNIITKIADKQNIYLGLGYGTYNTQNYELGYENVWAEVSEQIHFQRVFSEGYSYDTDLSNYSFLSKTGYKYTNGEAVLKFGYMDKAFGAFDFYTPGKNLPSREWTKTWLAEGEINNRLNSGINTTVKTYFRQHNDIFMLNLATPDLFVNRHVTYNYGLEIQGTLQLDADNYFVAGGMMEQDEIYSSNLGEHLQPRQAIFTGWNGQILKEIKVDAGLRLESSMWGSFLAPAIALSYKPASNIKLTASAGYSFRSPSFTELFYADGISFGNNELSPETAVTYDLGIDYSPGDDFFAAVSLYERVEANLIDWVGETPKGKWYAQNIGQANVYGIEGKVKTEILFLEINAGFSFIYAKKDTEYYSKYGLLYPAAQASFVVKGPEILQVTPQFSILHKRKSGVNDYTLLNVKLSRTFEGVTLYLESQNLTNVMYEEIKGISQPGITFSTGIMLKM